MDSCSWSLPVEISDDQINFFVSKKRKEKKKVKKNKDEYGRTIFKFASRLNIGRYKDMLKFEMYGL